MKCVLLDENCATGYIDDGRGNICVSLSSGCYMGFQLVDGACVIKLENLLARSTQLDSSGQ